MVTTQRARWLKASAKRKEETKQQEAERVSSSGGSSSSGSSSNVDPSKPSSVVFKRDDATVTKQTFQDGEVVSEEVIQTKETPKSSRTTTTELARQEQIMRRTEQLRDKGYTGSIEGKVYTELTEQELLLQKLSPETKAVFLPEGTARRTEAVEIQRKIKSGEPLTQKEQFRVLTGESATDIKALNVAIGKTEKRPGVYRERLEGIEKYQKEAKEFQESKQPSESILVSKTMYSENAGKRFQEKWAERLVKKEAEVYQQRAEERFALGVEGLDKNQYDNPVVSTLKSFGERAYMFTAGVLTGSTGRSVLLAGEKAGFYALSGGLALTNKDTRPAFVESTKEQTIGGFDAITPIKLKTLIETGEIKYDPEGTTNILLASALAQIQTVSIVKQRTVTPKKGSYKSDIIKTEITPKGRTIVEQGRFVNVRGDTIKTQTQYTLTKAGKGRYVQTLKDVTGKTVGSSKGTLAQNVKYNPDTKALEYQSVAKRGLFRQKEAGKGQYESSQVGKGTPESSTTVTKLTARVKKTGRVTEEYGVSKVSRVEAKGTTKVTTEEGMLGQGGVVSPTKTVTKTFTPKTITENPLTQNIALDKSPSVLEVSGKLFASKRGSVGASSQGGLDLQGFSGAIAEVNFAGTSLNPVTPSVPVRVPVTTQITQLTPITPTLPVGGSISLLTSQSPSLVLIPVSPVLGDADVQFKGSTQEISAPKLKIDSISQEQDSIKALNVAKAITDPISNVPVKAVGLSKPTEDAITKTEYQPSTEAITDLGGKTTTKNIVTSPTISISPSVPSIPPPPILAVGGAVGFNFAKEKRKQLKGYRVITKKGGKEQLLSQASFTKEEALQFGASRIGKTARASFKLVEAKGVTGKFKGKGDFTKFYKSKSGFFVEKSKFRIDTPGEVREISHKGIKAKKKKKNSKSIFKGIY